MTVEELRAAVETPLSADEIAHIDELYDWFTRAYPTPAARLRYAAHATRAWKRRRAAARQR